MSYNFKDGLNMAFSIYSISMGIYAIAPLKNLAAVIVGTSVGIILHLRKIINRGARGMQRIISHFIKDPSELDQGLFETALVTIIALLCASGTGIYETLTESIDGDAMIMVSKSVLDCFFALILEANLGAFFSLIVVPNFFLDDNLFLGSYQRSSDNA